MSRQPALPRHFGTWTGADLNANIIPIGNLRAFVIALVVAHHSVLAYAWYGHFNTQHYLWSSAPIVDQTRWIGFDVFLLFNDAFFMSLMFLLSGSLVPKALASAGGLQKYLVRRAMRLGIPFAFMVVVLMPLAYYPSIKMTGVGWSLGEFWRQTVTVGPWPGGPAWFIWVLLVFDAVAATLYSLPGFARRLSGAFSAIADRPALFFVALCGVSALVYLPMAACFGVEPWLAWGPFSVQTSRVLLYALYFFAGIGLGSVGWTRGLLAENGGLGAHWLRWSMAAGLAFGVILAMQLARQSLVEALGSQGWTLVYGGFFVLSCGASSVMMLSLFLRFGRSSSYGMTALSRSSYGIYIVHYVFVIWIQYLLLPYAIAAVGKAVIVYLAAMALSFASAALLRLNSTIARIV